MGRFRRRVRTLRQVLLFLVAVMILLPSRAAGRVVNYEDDEDLAAAIEHDLGLNGHNYEKADRSAAERHYLAYLERCEESFQRARVFYQLGTLYGINANRRKDEEPDPEKAKACFTRCLEEEPERIGYETIEARKQLAYYVEPVEKRIEARLAVYEWLLSADEEKVRRLYLPSRPDEGAPADAAVKRTLRTIYSAKSITISNVKREVIHHENSRELARGIAERFPEAELGKWARAYLELDLPKKGGEAEGGQAE